MEDAVTLNARHFIQMWQDLKRALEEFAQIKSKSGRCRYTKRASFYSNVARFEARAGRVRSNKIEEWKMPLH